MQNGLNASDQEIELCFVLRDLGLNWKPAVGDWVIDAVDRSVSTLIGQSDDERIVRSIDPTRPTPLNQVLWLPLEHQLRALLFQTGLAFISVESGTHDCKSYGWLNRNDWKSAEPESVWSKGDTVREAMLSMLIKIYTGETEWQWD